MPTYRQRTWNDLQTMQARLRNVLVYMCAVFLVGCYATPSDAGAPAEEEPSTQRGLPAYALPGERYGALKGDQYDDIRFDSPEWYAITAPSHRPGLRAMVEWEPMSALVLSLTPWVTSSSQMRTMYKEIVVAASEVAEVWIIYESATSRQLFEAALASTSVSPDALRWFPMPVESVWAVDYGPLPLIDDETGSVAFADFRYYHGRPLDDAIPTRLGVALGASTYRMPLSFEGGNIQADGEGRCFTTQRGLQYSGLAQAPFEQLLADYVGCDETVILKDVSNDATGHVDMFFKLVSKDRAVVGQYPPGLDAENEQRMDDNVSILEALSSPLTSVRLPMPGYGVTQGPLGGLGKSDIPFTYANSTLINGVNIWPVYSNPAWEASRAAAEAAWQEALPGYQHIGVNADEVAQSSGTIHCITRTIVAKPLQKWVPDGRCEAGTCTPPSGFEEVATTASCTDDSTCFGPAWLCGCNDCSAECAAPDPVGDSCLGVSYVGCCNDNLLMWCEDGKLRQQACAAEGCGFAQNQGFYSCGQTGPAPSDLNAPMECPDLTSCTPACEGRACGPDGCGGTCGACEDGAECIDGLCDGTHEGTTDGGTADDGDIVSPGGTPHPGGAGCVQSISAPHAGREGSLLVFALFGWLCAILLRPSRVV